MKARTKDRLRRFGKLKNHTARIFDFSSPVSHSPITAALSAVTLSRLRR
jgi:hypothetical protein